MSLQILAGRQNTTMNHVLIDEPVAFRSYLPIASNAGHRCSSAWIYVDVMLQADVVR